MSIDESLKNYFVLSLEKKILSEDVLPLIYKLKKLRIKVYDGKSHSPVFPCSPQAPKLDFYEYKKTES